MRERIGQLAEGKLQVEAPQLIFFPDHLNREVPAGAVISLDVLVKSKNKIPFKGFFYSSDERVKVCTPSRSGQVGTVDLEINTKNCKIGEEISGELQMVSNAGEKQLEYRFRVVGSTGERLPSSLSEFAALYRESAKKAQNLFLSDTFLSLPFMSEAQYIAIYEGIAGKNRDDQAVEAFLAACGAKLPVTFFIEQEQEDLSEKKPFNREIHISINTWGYVKIHVESDSEWLIPETNILTGSDFHEGRAVLSYQINPKYLHAGVNIARITCKSDMQTETIALTLHKKQPDRTAKNSTLSRELKISLYQMFLEYLNSSYEDQVILASLDRNINSCIKKYPAEISLYLLRTWILVENEHKKEASALLEWCRDSISRNRGDMPVEYCIFLYLDSKIRQDERVTENAYRIIHKYYESKPNLFIALLGLYVFYEDASAEEKLHYMEELQEAYGSSPLIYALAAKLYRENPALLNQSTQFTLSVFHYMVKYNCTTAELKQRFLKLTGGFPLQNPLLLRTLQRMYQNEKDTKVLSEICSILVRMQKTGEKYFKWYEEGIQKEIQLTGLSDYYLASRPSQEESEIPVGILLYYSYKNNLDDKTKLDLYFYVLNHYQKGSDMYRAYEEEMGVFATRQLISGKINPRLVLLYRSFFGPELVDRRLARVLPDLLYSRQITTSLSFAKKVIICYPQLKQEFSAVLENKSACIPVYTDNAVVLFEDSFGNRYADESYKMETLMQDRKLADICRKQSPNQLMLQLEDSSYLYRQAIPNEKAYELACRLLENTQLSNSYRSLLIQRKIEYCYYCCLQNRGALSQEDAEWLRTLPLVQLSGPDRAHVIELYVTNGFIKDAFSAVSNYGYDQVSLPCLLKLAVLYITESLYEYNETLLRLGRFLLQQKQYNETLISYMAQHYNGTTDSMLTLLMLAQDMKAKSYDLAERVVAQMMFTGNVAHLDEAYACYSSTGRVADLIRQAYLVLKCHEYLMGRESISSENVQMIENLMLSEETDNLSAGFPLALLQYYGGLSVLNETQKKLCENLVYGLCAKDLYLGCYLSLGKHIEMPHQMEGRIIVQHQGEPDEQVWMDGIRKPQRESVHLELKQVYPGIYTGAFFLFSDESLELALYHANNTEVKECDRLVLHTGNAYIRENSLYDKINKRVLLFEQGNYEELKRHSAAAERSRRVVRDLFTLM